MFSLTSNATTALMAARTECGVPDTWGIRFFAPVEGRSDLTFDFVASPEPNDIIGGSRDLRTYVAAETDRRIGDATVDFEDQDGIRGLVITPYPAGRAS